MSYSGFKLELPSGTVYEFRDDVIVDENGEMNPLYDGRDGQFTALFERWLDVTGGQSVNDSPMQSAIISGGAGARSWECEAVVYEDSTDTFGGAASSDAAVTKVQTLMHDLANGIYDSNNPITFNWQEYSSSGKFGPLSVVPFTWDSDINRRESSSEAGVRLTLIETANLNISIDDLGASFHDLFLKPLTSQKPRIPIPVDTLGLGAQTLPQGISESGIVSLNGSSGGAATLPTKILPERIRLRGAFRGTNVPDIVAAAKDDVLAATDVEKVEVKAPNNTPELDPLTGTYTLGPDSGLDPIDPRVENIYGFDFDLREA